MVAKLRAAGAVILGTLNMEEAALGAKTDNPWFGATQNPHRMGYTPGGTAAATQIDSRQKPIRLIDERGI